MCACVFFSAGTDHGELVGRGSVLKQQIDDVGVALLRCLVEWSVTVLGERKREKKHKKEEERRQNMTIYKPG